MSKQIIRSSSTLLFPDSKTSEKSNHKDEPPERSCSKTITTEKLLLKMQSRSHSSPKMEKNSKNLKVKDKTLGMSESEHMNSNEILGSLPGVLPYRKKWQNVSPFSKSDSRLLMRRWPVRSKFVSNKECFESLVPNKIYYRGSKIIIDLGITSRSNSESKLIYRPNTTPSKMRFENDSRNIESLIKKAKKPLIKVDDSNETFLLKKESLDDLNVVCIKGRKTLIEINNMNPKLDFNVSHQKDEGKLIVTVCNRTEQFTSECNSSSGSILQNNTPQMNEIKYKENEKTPNEEGLEKRSTIVPLSKSGISFVQPLSHKYTDDLSNAIGVEKKSPGHINRDGSANPFFVLPESFTSFLIHYLDNHNNIKAKRAKKNYKHVASKPGRSVEKCMKSNTPRKINKTRKIEEHYLSEENNNEVPYSEDLIPTADEFLRASNEHIGGNSLTDSISSKPRMKDDIKSSEAHELRKMDEECMMVCKDNFASLDEKSKINQKNIPDLFKLCSFNAQQQQLLSQLVSNAKRPKYYLQKPQVKKRSLDESKKVKFDTSTSNNNLSKNVIYKRKSASPGNNSDSGKIKGIQIQTKMIGKSVPKKKISTPLVTAKKPSTVKSKNFNLSSIRKPEEKGGVSKKSTKTGNLRSRQRKMTPTDAEEKVFSKRSSHKYQSAINLDELTENNEQLESNEMVKSFCFDPTISLGKVNREKHNFNSVDPHEIRSLIRNKILGFMSLIKESGSPSSKYGSSSDAYTNISCPFSPLSACNLNLSGQHYPQEYTFNSEDIAAKFPMQCENDMNAIMDLTRRNQYSSANNLHTSSLEINVTKNEEAQSHSDIIDSIETFLCPINGSAEKRESVTEIDGELTVDTFENNGGITDLNVLGQAGVKRNHAGVPTPTQGRAPSYIASIYPPQSTLVTIGRNSPQGKDVENSQDNFQNFSTQDISKKKGNNFVIQLNDNMIPVMSNLSKLTEQLKQLQSDNYHSLSSRKASEEFISSDNETIDSGNTSNSEYIINETNISINSLISLLSEDDLYRVRHENSRIDDLETRETDNSTIAYHNAHSTTEGSASSGLSNFPWKLVANNHETKSLEFPKHSEPQMENREAFRKFPNVLKRNRSETLCSGRSDLDGSDFIKADEYSPHAHLESEIEAEALASSGLLNFSSKFVGNNHETQSLEITEHRDPQMENSKALRKYQKKLKRNTSESFFNDSTDLSGSEFVRADEYFPHVDLETDIDLDIKDDVSSSRSSCSTVSVFISPSKQAELGECEVDSPELEGALNMKPTSSFYFFAEEIDENHANAGAQRALSSQRKYRKKRFDKQHAAFMKFLTNYSQCTHTPNKTSLPWAVPVKLFRKKSSRITKSGRKGAVKEHNDDDAKNVLKKKESSAKKRKEN